MSAEKDNLQKKEPSRLRRAFKRAALGGLGLIMTAAALEWTGYNVFNGKNGGNIITKIDPSSRMLTNREKELAYEIFGDKLDTDKIKIFDRTWFKLPPSYQYITPNGNIYIGDGGSSEDFSTAGLYRKSIFIHELTHALQRQQGTRVIHDAIKLWLKNDKNYWDSYDYNLSQTKDFYDLNIEQQGEVFQDFFLKLEAYKKQPLFSAGYELRPYAEILSPHFPSVRKLLEKVGYKDPLADVFNSATNENIKPQIKPSAQPFRTPKPALRPS